MPILDARHDLAHPVEGDSAWSESYYFNAYDPGTDSGLFSRIGIRPNEGTMDVGLSLWLPDGQLGEYHWVKEQREMVDSVLEVGAVRYEMLQALQSWRLTMEGEVQARPCVRGETATRPVPVALDVRFDAVTPAIGTDGQPSGGPKSAEAAAAAGTVGKGHLEQAGRWTGTLTVDGTRHEWHGAHGNRDRSWGPRRWGGPKMWRWFSVNIGEDMHFGGIRLGTDAGDLHRGWVWDGTRATSVAEWRVLTELADDGVTHRVVHLDVVDKMGRTYPLRGDVLRVADIGRAGGTMVNEGLARWTYEDPAGERGPATGSASTCTSSTTAGGLSSPSSRDGPTAEHRRAGGRARAPAGRQRARAAPAVGWCLPGHRARSNSSGPAAPHARSFCRWTAASAPSPAGSAWRGRSCGRRAPPACRCRASSRSARTTTSASAGWWWSAWRARRSRARSCATANGPGPAAPSPRRPATPWPPSTRSTRAPFRGWRRPTRWATPCPSSMRWARYARRWSSACAGWARTARPTGPASSCTATTGWATSWSGRTGCAASSTGSWRTRATRPRTSAGCAPPPGASAARARSAVSAALDELLAAYAVAGGEAMTP